MLQRGRLVQVRHENEEKRDTRGSIEFPVGVFLKERRDTRGSIEFLVALQKTAAIETRAGRSKAVFWNQDASGSIEFHARKQLFEIEKTNGSIEVIIIEKICFIHSFVHALHVSEKTVRTAGN